MIYLVSGKRASGKDTFCSLLDEKLGGKCRVIALADAPKKAFCERENLDFSRFMSDRAYKEMYRKQFIDFAEGAKLRDKYIWCKTAIEGTEVFDNIVISDLRYPIELHFFRKFFPEKFVTIRIEASDEIRKSRGWNYTAVVDEHISETGMDDIDFDYVIRNDTNDNGDAILKQLNDLEII